MKTGTRPDTLELLGHLLQAGLQAELSEHIPVQVRCLLKEGTLVVLVQHRASVEPEPQQIFEFLEQEILAEPESVSNQVKIYLRVAGQKRAYASYSFAIEPSVESTATSTSVEQKLEPPILDSSSADEDLDSQRVKPESILESETSITHLALPHPWDVPGSESEAENQAETTPDASPEDEIPPQETAISGKKRFNSSVIPLIVTGIGVSLVVFTGSLYLLTRPCVIGSCRTISEAQELRQRSANTLQSPESGKAVLEAQQQLKDAIRMLQSIPVWSGYHGEAQQLIKEYQAQSERVDEMVQALKTGARAAYKSENPPHSVSRWIEIQSLWREAIVQLEQLPTKSNLQPLAQQKIKEYKANLAIANQRMFKERQAQDTLKAAKEAALFAEARQGVAQSLAHWQLVYATWQTAMKRLKQIPQGTTAYEEGKQLSALYLPKMASARDRKMEEQIATNAYNQGLRLAQRAQTAQAGNQWPAALNHWRNALTYVNQVPSGTFYYGKAQSLVNSYTSALNQAQGEVQIAIKLQQIGNDLKQTCSGKAQVCTYTLDKNVIRVRLTPTYVQLVRQVAVNAQTNRDANIQSSLVNHILTLGQALETISNNARIPLQLYDPDGSLIKENTPGT
jgi:tetratricopeptide (TPR) repeat protein